MEIDKYQDFQDRFDEFENQEELEDGAQIQTEHKPTYDLIKKYFDETGELPDEDWVYKSISADHTEELEDYYNPQYGLPNWEKGMENRENTEGTGRKFDEKGENLIVQDVNENKILKLNDFLNENMKNYTVKNISKDWGEHEWVEKCDNEIDNMDNKDKLKVYMYYHTIQNALKNDFSIINKDEKTSLQGVSTWGKPDVQLDTIDLHYSRHRDDEIISFEDFKNYIDPKQNFTKPKIYDFYRKFRNKIIEGKF